MHITEIFHDEDASAALEGRLITIRKSDDVPDRLIYNYTDRANFTADSWANPAVLNSRGLIVDGAGTIIARPWPKFFNYGQHNSTMSLDSPVEVTDKVDGSHGIAFLDDTGKIRIATRGSLVSEQANHATDVWRDKYSDVKVPGEYTFLFEIVYPENKIVLDYGDMDDLILLGAVHIDTGRAIGPTAAEELLSWPGPVVEVFEYKTFADALKAESRPNAEGVVVRNTDTGKMLKIKQEDYLLLHRAVFGLSPKRIWELLASGQTPEDILSTFPDEFTDDVSRMIQEILHSVNTILEETFEYYGKISYIESRKEFAQEALKYSHPGLLFLLRDMNTTKFMEAAWDATKPKSVDRGTVV